MADLERRLDDLLEARGDAPAATGTGKAPPPAAASVQAAPATPADALDSALGGAAAPTAVAAPGPKGDIWSAPLAGGRAEARLIDTSIVTLAAGGGSSVDDAELGDLQGGAHDPNQNGFTLQQAELSFSGAIDPYFTGEAHIVATTGGLELEEAFFTTSSLPYGLQVEAGYFFTEFGLINPAHPHAWDWLDQPVVNTRMFGGDGTRSPGVRLGWLMPTSFFSEFHVGVQNADEGEFTPSFLGEEAVAGRPNVHRDVDGLGDFLWLARWNSSFDLSDDTAILLGLSNLYGPNGTGADGDTWIHGGDVKVRWRSPNSFRGWPFVLWQTEVIVRRYHADGFVGGTDAGATGDFPNDLSSDTLRDIGFYTQLLYGFHYGWAAGLRAEYATGSGESIDAGVPVPRREDPLRDDRWRLSPMLVWHPSEFSRLRLQYNYDHADHVGDGGDAHTLWFGGEVLYGKHGAHKY